VNHSLGRNFAAIIDYLLEVVIQWYIGLSLSVRFRALLPPRMRSACGLQSCLRHRCLCMCLRITGNGFIILNTHIPKICNTFWIVALIYQVSIYEDQ